MQIRPYGYCPRCNAKARHRRDWLYLQENTDLFDSQLRLLHISPKYSLSRRLSRMTNIHYVGVDCMDRLHIQVLLDVSALSFKAHTFDCLICIHVLEEVREDHTAFQELFRVLKPGGWALITVPLNLNQKTYEDWSITDPLERERAFGEKAHVRVYGYNVVDRLQKAGFHVSLDKAGDITKEKREQYGLKENENVLFCTKPPDTP